MPAGAGPDGWAFAARDRGARATLGPADRRRGDRGAGAARAAPGAGLRAGPGIPVRAADAGGEEVAERRFAARRDRPGGSRPRRPIRLAAGRTACQASVMFLLYAVAHRDPRGLLLGRAAVRPRRPSRSAGRRSSLAGLLVQVVLFTDAVAERVGDLGPALYVGSTMAVAGGCRSATWAIPGMPLVAAGAVCNLAAILANGGYMPARRVAALAALGKAAPTLYSNSSVVPGPGAVVPHRHLRPAPRAAGRERVQRRRRADRARDRGRHRARHAPRASGDGLRRRPTSPRPATGPPTRRPVRPRTDPTDYAAGTSGSCLPGQADT